MNTYLTEKEFSEHILCRLSTDFWIDREVTGTHFTGRKMRIDAIISPKKSFDWKNQSIAFGIEFKKHHEHISPRVISGMIKQGYDYMHCEFGRFGKVPILLCPLTSEKWNYAMSTEQSRFVKRVLGDFMIGEITDTYRGLSIVFKENHVIWDESSGVLFGKTWDFKIR